MKSHDLAQALTILARVLRAGPNIEVGDLRMDATFASNGNNRDNAAASLLTLVELSRFDKSDWRAIIEENNFPILVRPRDASRDLIGKLLRYLEEDKDARERLRNSIGHKPSKASPELLRALNTLLKD
jgi:hypothetical protein